LAFSARSSGKEEPLGVRIKGFPCEGTINILEPPSKFIS
jgi:hypothetical protein